MATRANTSIFVGTKRQITNQWVQWFILAMSCGLILRLGLDVLGIQDRGWGMALYALKTGLCWGFAWWLVQGKLGEFLNGPRIAEDREPSFLETVSRDGGVIPTSVANSPTQTNYFPTGSASLEQAPKRQPIRQVEEN